MNFQCCSRLLLLIAGLLAGAACSPQAQAKRNFPSPWGSASERVRYGERNRQFARIWLSRAHNPDEAARKILPFVLEKVAGSADLPTRAVVALGRIESPVAQKPLEKLLFDAVEKEKQWLKTSRQEPPPSFQVAPYYLRFALARIESRNMKGQARLDFVARKIGKTWSSVRREGREWKGKLRDPKQRGAIYEFLRGRNSPRLTLEEFAQLLHDMGQRGENVNALGASDLLVWPTGRVASGGLCALFDPPQTVILTANMTRDQAIRFWLQRALPPQKPGVERAGSFSPQAFLDLGAPAVKALKVTLRDLLEQVKRDPSIVDGVGEVGPRTLFEAAAASGDHDFIPILQEFAHLKIGWLSSYAARDVTLLENGEGAAILPRPLLYFGSRG